MTALRLLWLFLLLLLSLSASLPSTTRSVAASHSGTTSTTTIKSVATITVGIAPVSIQYAESNQEVYIENAGDGTVSVISSATNKVITTIDTSCYPYNPYLIEYNPANQEVYQPCSAGNINGVPWNLVAISTSTNTVAARVYSGNGGAARGLVYAGGSNNNIYYISCCQYVGTTAYNIVTAVSSANKVVKSVQVGFNCYYLVYDAKSQDVYAGCEGDGYVYVISTATNSVVTKIYIGGRDYYMVDAASSNEILVLQQGPFLVDVISAATNSLFTTVSLPSSTQYTAGIGYDPANQEVYVGTSYYNSKGGVSYQIVAISTTSNSIVATIQTTDWPYYMVYDNSNQNMYMSLKYSNQVIVVSSPTNQIVAAVTTSLPEYNEYDPANAEVYVVNDVGTNSIPGTVTAISS